MTLLATPCGWILGIFLGIQLIAAWYGPIDYACCEGRHARAVAIRIVAWTGLTIILLTAVPGPFGEWLLQGLGFMVAVHVAMIPLPWLFFTGFRLKHRLAYGAFIRRLARNAT